MSSYFATLGMTLTTLFQMPTLSCSLGDSFSLYSSVVLPRVTKSTPGDQEERGGALEKVKSRPNPRINSPGMMIVSESAYTQTLIQGAWTFIT